MRYPTFAEGWNPQSAHHADVEKRPIEHRPHILIAEEEHRDLSLLASSARTARPAIAELLADELGRAVTVPFRELPPNVVCMNAVVEYRHDDLDRVRRMKLVYPQHADIDARRLSILTSVGAGLIGLAEGMTMEFSVRPGSRARLTVMKVIPPDIFGNRKSASPSASPNSKDL